jgi:hypothetical protein
MQERVGPSWDGRPARKVQNPALAGNGEGALDFPFRSPMVVIQRMNMKSLSFSGNEWSFFWNFPLLWAVVLSFSLNTGFLYLTLEHYAPQESAGSDLLTLDLLPPLPSWLNEVRRQVTSPASKPPTALTFVTGEAAQAMFDKVRVGLSDPALDYTLREIKGTIGSRWEWAEPPSWGKVLLVMEVAPSGSILNVGINRISGPQGLEGFVFDLVKSVAPFTGAMAGQTEPVWVECEFTVEALEEGA